MNALVSTSKFPRNLETLFNQVFDGAENNFLFSNEQGFPPYNAWFDENGNCKIEIAVAGFNKDEITIDFDGKSLSISGEKVEPEAEDGRRWIKRGLAKRKFVRRFDVRGSFAIESAVLKSGILTVSLKDETKRISIEVVEE